MCLSLFLSDVYIFIDLSDVYIFIDLSLRPEALPSAAGGPVFSWILLFDKPIQSDQFLHKNNRLMFANSWHVSGATCIHHELLGGG